MNLETFEFDAVETAGQKVAREALTAWQSGNVSATREALKKIVAILEDDPAAFEFLVPFVAVGTQIADQLNQLEALDCRCGDHIVWARHREALLLETLVDAVGRVLPEGLSWRSALRRYNSAVAREFISEARWSAAGYTDMPFLVQQLDALGRLDLESGLVDEIANAREDLLIPVVLGEPILSEIAITTPRPMTIEAEPARFGWLKTKTFKLAS